MNKINKSLSIDFAKDTKETTRINFHKNEIDFESLDIIVFPSAIKRDEMLLCIEKFASTINHFLRCYNFSSSSSSSLIEFIIRNKKERKSSIAKCLFFNYFHSF